MGWNDTNVYSYTTSVVEVFKTRYCTISLLKTILTWRGSKSDHGGVSSRARLFHCTRTGLTPAITANVGNSTVQFLVVGVCVRAHPLQYAIKTQYITCYIYLQVKYLWYIYTYVRTYTHTYMPTYIHAKSSYIFIQNFRSVCLSSQSSLIQQHIFIC